MTPETLAEESAPTETGDLLSLTPEDLRAELRAADLRFPADLRLDELETRVGELGSQLSGGEGRRLALARVLLKQAPIVVLDEPFTGLDRAIADRVRSGIGPWLAGRSVVFMLHESPGRDLVQREIRL